MREKPDLLKGLSCPSNSLRSYVSNYFSSSHLINYIFTEFPQICIWFRYLMTNKATLFFPKKTMSDIWTLENQVLYCRIRAPKLLLAIKTTQTSLPSNRFQKHQADADGESLSTSLIVYVYSFLFLFFTYNF